MPRGSFPCRHGALRRTLFCNHCVRSHRPTTKGLGRTHMSTLALAFPLARPTRSSLTWSLSAHRRYHFSPNQMFCRGHNIHPLPRKHQRSTYQSLVGAATPAGAGTTKKRKTKTHPPLFAVSAIFFSPPLFYSHLFPPHDSIQHLILESTNAEERLMPLFNDFHFSTFLSFEGTRERERANVYFCNNTVPAPPPLQLHNTRMCATIY